MNKIVAFLVLALATMGLAQTKTETVTRVKSGGAAVYKTESGEEGDKLVDIGTGEEVTLLKQSKGRSLIKTGGGIRGWVDNNTLERVKVSSGGRHNLKDVEVVGWLDNPSAVYILDNTNPDLNALPIDRDFNKEIVEVKDRESVERTYDEN
jgi:hypothetical protein